ncbi:vanillate/3-O-methylgallate O-demethylase [Actinomadura meyerae]|jgi:glycine cleavage system aminomethyltransferase T|uniref:Vanillate/3-O-methylgallate O-demethylase n=1 Tax=Actinomadura meyerae TaxID=240840 RepID=A0A239NGM7_9ACTN|nr:aminomethyltransferase family protein [Actinomadura meyerae]SNT53574.1 vanillate/3-O-methylgallate O-demethylase [Actinomadura meyerae]
MTESLEAKIARIGNPVDMLRSAGRGSYPFPVPREHTNWRDEQEAWGTTATLFDQSHHMTDIYFKGPDTRRLLSDFGVNDFTKFGPNKGKQFVACNEDGGFIGDAILFGLGDDEFSLVGTPTLPNWIAYNAETGGYDVEVRRDERSSTVEQEGRSTYRYQIQGPLALKIIEKASGGSLPDIRFFNIGTFTIAGTPVRALNHTMTGIPGEEHTGLELWGPVEHGPRVLEAIVAAGEEFGMRRGGALAYASTTLESGWIGLTVPAIYTQESLKPYREYLPGDGYEGASALGGSLLSDDIEDYYLTPWDLGYGRLIHWDHEFLGRDALRSRVHEPHRVKVSLAWNADDAARVMLDGLLREGTRTRYFELPSIPYSTFQYDMVQVKDSVVGISTRAGYNSNVRGFSSLAMLDEAAAEIGGEVVVTWGEPDGGAAKPHLESHVQASIRATVTRHF